MRLKLLSFAAAILAAPCDTALAAGELQIFNWGDYTNPELIKKFEDEYNVEVTVTDYDSNDTALAKVRAGGHGFDIVVPSASFIPIWVEEGLLLETRPDQMENFKNVDPRWIDVPFDPGHHYTVPWQWGTTGILLNTKYSKADPNTSAIFLDPPDELKGRINVVPEMSDVMNLAIRYSGGEWCSGDRAMLKKVRDTLMNAKQYWMSMDYGNQEKLEKEDIVVGVGWSGATLRARLKNPAIVYGYPREGYPIWMDSVAVLKDAKNIENAKLFQNFIMDPENAALISAFAKYSNGIKGSEAFMPSELKSAPEIVVPDEFKSAGNFSLTCPPEVNDLYTNIWIELLK